MNIIYQIIGRAISQVINLLTNVLGANKISRETQKVLLLVGVAWFFAGLLVLEVATAVAIVLYVAKL